MKGTEKQIEWASSIVKMIGMIFKKDKKMQANHPMINQIKDMHNKIIENMNNMKAEDIIDDFKDIVKHEDKVMEDYKDVLNQIVVCEMTKGRAYRK